MPDSIDHDPATAELGSALLAQIVARSPEGIALVDEDRRWSYANPAAHRLLGRPAGHLVGLDVSETVTPREQELALRRFDEVLDGAAATVTGRVETRHRPDRELQYSIFALDGAPQPIAAAVLSEISGPGDDARTAAALARTVAQLVGLTPTSEILADVARHAVEETCAVGVGIAVADEDNRLTVGGGYGPSGRTVLDDTADWGDHLASGEDVVEVLTAGAIRLGGPVGAPVLLAEARDAWARNALTASFAQALQGIEWRSAVCVPVGWNNRVIGVLRVYLPIGVSSPSESELAFFVALADHAAVAVANARLTAQAARTAALRERSVLARELHDSVSQALFSMALHARAAQLAPREVESGPGATLDRSIAQLVELARSTLAEMRALIFELRPEALGDEGLVRAVSTQAASLSAREHTLIEVRGPSDRLGLDPDVEEQIYRIVMEALNNVVKHASATRAVVDIERTGDEVRVRVSDDGVGFDTTRERLGHLGLSTMAHRADAVGGSLTITVSNGTTVAFAVPVGARVHSEGL